MPALVLVSAERAEFLADEFGRYRRDYEVHTATSTSEAETLAGEITGAGGQVAMFVSESTLPDAPVMEASGRWRSVVPTARRLVWRRMSHASSTTLPCCAPASRPASSTPTC